MKLVIAIVKPHRLEDVIDELNHAGIQLKTVTQILGSGVEQGYTEIYRGRMETGNLLKKIRFEIAVNDDALETTLNAIIKGVKSESGQAGDGKIFVVDLCDCINIRTGERGSVAVGQ